jgi:hypothetical protein
MKTNEKNGYVYFLKHNGLNPIKIGSTVGYSPMSRVNSYNSYSPYGVELLGYIKTDTPLELEKKIHYNFSENRINGEWFELSVITVIEFINVYNINNDKNYILINHNEKSINKNEKSIINFINTLPNNIKIYNDELYDLYVDYFKIDINIKRILKEIKYSGIEYIKDRDSLGRYLIINNF